MAQGTDGANLITFRRPPPGRRAVLHRFWSDCLDQLERYLSLLNRTESAMSDLAFDYPAAEPAMIVTRSFAAPLALVWRAFTEPHHVIRWWGPASLAPIKRIEALDLRPGGAWRFVCERPDGSAQLVFYGTYLEVVPMQKLSNSFGVEGAFPPDPASPEQHFFSERDGRTWYRSYTLLPSFDARDATLATGMETGARQSMEQLAQLVEEIAGALV